MPKDLSDELIKETAGKLVRVTYSMVDEYHFEPALSSAFAGSKSTFTGLRIGMNRNRRKYETSVISLCSDGIYSSAKQA